MATVVDYLQLMNEDWHIWQSGPLDEMDAGYWISFYLTQFTTTSGVYAKICKMIDTSQYDEIVFEYTAHYSNGYGTSLEFSIFDNMEDLSGQTIIAPDDWSSYGGRVTVNISNLSGVKYIGFQFFGDPYAFEDEFVSQDVSIATFEALSFKTMYTLTYNANGGSGAPSSVSNISSTTISSIVPTRSGYDFLGWSTSSSATSANYLPGASITLSSNTTLYAIWKPRGLVYIYDHIGEYNPYQVLIYDGADWNQYIPYIRTESGWEVYSG